LSDDITSPELHLEHCMSGLLQELQLAMLGHVSAIGQEFVIINILNISVTMTLHDHAI